MRGNLQEKSYPNLAKVRVARSNRVARSKFSRTCGLTATAWPAAVARIMLMRGGGEAERDGVFEHAQARAVRGAPPG